MEFSQYRTDALLTITNRPPLVFVEGEGMWLTDHQGKRYLDFNSQLMCVNIGHSHPRVIKAIQQQAATLAYANPFMATEPRALLGEKLAQITPGDIDAFFFTNGGAEANENAIKIARWYTGRHKILAFYRSYHGGTAGAISLTGDPRRWAAEPGLPGILGGRFGIRCADVDAQSRICWEFERFETQVKVSNEIAWPLSADAAALHVMPGQPIDRLDGIEAADPYP